MGMEMKISIIIPYKEDRGYLSKAIQSAEASLAYSKAKGEIILSQSENGVSYNLNRGLERAKGEFVTYLCDDDLLPLEAIKHTLDGMRGYDFIHGNARCIYEDNFTFKEPRIRKYRPDIIYPSLMNMLEKNRIHGGTVTYRRDILEGQWFDEDLWTGEEYDFNLYLLKEGKQLGYINEDLYIYRHHGLQKSKQNDNQSERRSAIERIKDRYR